MLDHVTDINWLGVVAGTISFAVLGGLYFAVLAPKAYAYAIGREGRPPEPAGSALFYVGPLVCSLFVVLADAILITALHITTVDAAMTAGTVVALGFLIPMAFTIAINPLFPRPLTYGLLNAPYFLVGNLLATILLIVIP